MHQYHGSSVAAEMANGRGSGMAGGISVSTLSGSVISWLSMAWQQ